MFLKTMFLKTMFLKTLCKCKGREFGAILEANMGMNGAPMAPHGPILSEDGATPIRMLAICLLGLFETRLD